MAEVFIAHRLSAPEQSLVLKRIRPDHAENSEYLRRFVLEAQVLSRLSHPNLVHFREFGMVGECHYITMDLVKGYSLSRLLDRVFEDREPPPLEAGLHIAQGLLDGLAAMHAVKDENGRARPMLHRDVTPSNVIVMTDGTPVLIDFGIAKDVMGPAITLPGKVIGTARYMSPEHRKAEFIDTRADVFSASAILYELMIGISPWPPLESLKELLRTTFDPPDVPPEARARIAEDVIDLMVKGLACDPQDRWASAQEMGAALKRCESSVNPIDGARYAADWIASLRMPTDDDLEDPVLDHAPPSGPNDRIWTAKGSIEESGRNRIAPPPPANEMPAADTLPDARVLTIPPLPPARESVLATGDINVRMPAVTGRPVWVAAILIMLVVVGLVCGVVFLRGHL
jgi:eukaryotic-like serine/threonine-protein kinase